MDTQRFDHLSRRIGKQTSRRGMVKAAAGGMLALVGAGAVGRSAAAVTGYEGAPCDTAADCQTGLICQGSTTGILGGVLADTQYGPPGITLPVLTGRSGTCRYHANTDSCAKVDQACRRNDDCCDGLNLECHNNTCKRRN